jgi:Na+/H+ antiporter NhaD/arsenite permease-like protein
VGNDPLILSGTPFLAYLTSNTGLEPTAWIFSEFMAANTASAVLVSSNPTNILIAGSFSLNFLTQFTKWTILPTIVPAILNYGVVYAMFRKHIPKVLTPLDDDPWTKLRDRTGAVFLSVLMVVTVAVLVGTSFVPGHAVEVWMVTAPAGILAFIFNLTRDSLDQRHHEKLRANQAADPAAEMQPIARHDSSTSNNFPTQRKTRSRSLREVNNAAEAVPADKAVLPPPATTMPSPTTEPMTLTTLLAGIRARFPSTTLTLHRLPLPLLPFAICEFILVRGLSQRGWIRVFAAGFSHAVGSSPAASVFFFAFISAAFLCPLAGTNIGATIILVEILRSDTFLNSVGVLADERVLWGAVYAVAMGSNLGAFSYTFAGSLAGLLWRGLLADKGVQVSQRKFALVNFAPLVMQTSVAAAIVWGELYWFGTAGLNA